MSVYLSVAPPDGFSNWGELEWERWLKDPSLGDVWAEVFDRIDKVLESALRQQRGIYFGNV